jgi:hypothetical protein
VPTDVQREEPDTVNLLKRPVGKRKEIPSPTAASSSIVEGYIYEDDEPIDEYIARMQALEHSMHNVFASSTAKAKVKQIAFSCEMAMFVEKPPPQIHNEFPSCAAGQTESTLPLPGRCFTARS